MGISAKVQMRAPNNDQRSATGAIEAMKRGRIVPKTVQNWGKTVQNWGKTVQNGVLRDRNCPYCPYRAMRR